MTLDKLLDNAKQELQDCETGSIHHAFYSGYIKALQDILERGLYNDSKSYR